jgi:FtsZ-interacting cell division protein YlmF
LNKQEFISLIFNKLTKKLISLNMMKKFVSFFQKDSYSLLKNEETQEEESNQQVAKIIESQQQQLREQERKDRDRRERESDQKTKKH